MNINHDNYEMFFLLYVDNELSAGERAEVEAYVAANPDLYEEFMQLQEMVLPVEEPIVFSGKDALYKSAVLEDALQDDLLTHLDGELSGSKLSELKGKINNSPALQTEWAILQQTKLDAAEIISFPDKQLLYRKEREGVVVLRMMRWAVAAALIGAGIFISVKFLDNKPATDQPAVSTINEGKSNNVGALNPNDVPALASGQTSTKQPVTTAKVDQQIASTNVGSQTKTTVTAKTSVKNNQSLPGVQPGNDVDNPLLASNNAVPGKKVSPERAIGELAVTKPNKRPEVSQSLTDINLQPMDNATARTAGLADITQEEDPDRILYMNEENLTRTKAGGFLRKIKRMVERNAKVRTGNGIRIAGFELAAK